MTHDPITVLPAGPDDMARAGLRALLAEAPRFLIVGETGGGGVVALARRLCPDIVVIDPVVGGRVEAGVIAELCAVCPNSRVMVIADATDAWTFLLIMQAGAQGSHGDEHEILRFAQNDRGGPTAASSRKHSNDIAASI